MPDRLLELEKEARYGHEMPTELTQSEQLFYLSMTQLYALYHSKIYTREVCHDMKQSILAAYETNAFHERLIQYHACIRNSYSEVLTEAEKHGCPICRKLVRIFDGRE